MNQPRSPLSRFQLTGRVKTVERALVAVVECLVIVSVLGVLGVLFLADYPQGRALFIPCSWLLAILMAVSRFRAWQRSSRPPESGAAKALEPSTRPE